MHFNTDPNNEPLLISEVTTRSAAKDGKYLYLGMLFICSNNITEIIIANQKHRAFIIKKFYDWIEINENTPIKVKLQVLDTCMFPAYFYGAETWWKIDTVANMILIKERKMLKRILGVKQGTSNGLICIELERPDIISRIKDLQYKFGIKVNSFQTETAVVAKALEMCKHLEIYKYYNEIPADNQRANKICRITKIRKSSATMSSRYKDLCCLKKNDILYENHINEDYRKALTRWRLPSFGLRIGTGRYDNTPRELRICNFCMEDNIEDEQHIIYICEYYKVIRSILKTNNILSTYANIIRL